MTQPFWINGLRFECQGSGQCCTTREGYGRVNVTLKDRRRLAAHLEIRTSDFTRQYCRREQDDDLFLKDPECDCLLLVDHGCSVYAARPKQCRTWPFWAENMNPSAWKKEVMQFCAGAGKGRLHSADEIKAMLAEHSED